MVTLGSMQPAASFQGGFHVPGPQQYDDTLSLQSLQLALDDIALSGTSSMSTSNTSTNNTNTNTNTTHVDELQQPQQLQPATRRSSVSLMGISDRRPSTSSGEEEQQSQPAVATTGHGSRGGTATRPSTYTVSSASHRLFRQAKPEPPRRTWQQVQQQQPHQQHGGGSVLGAEKVMEDTKAVSWRASDTSSSSSVSKPPGLSIPSQQQRHGDQLQQSRYDGNGGSEASPRTMRRSSQNDSSRSQNEASVAA